MTHALSDLVGRAYGSLTGPEGHASFVKSLTHAFRSHLIAHQIDRPGHAHAPLSHFGDDGKSVAALAVAASRQPYVNPWFESPLAYRLLRDGVAGDEGCIEPARLRRTDFYADILQPFDIFHSLGLLLEQGSATSVITISRSHRVGHFSPREFELARQLLPHLRNVHAIQKTLAGSRLVGSTEGEHAVWALAADGRVCGHDEQRMQRFADGACAVIRVREDGLFPVHASDRSMFADAVADILSGSRLHRRIPLRDRSGTPRGVVHINHCPREASLTWLLTDAAAALVTLQPLDCKAGDLGPTLTRIYGLTVAECRVATKLLELESVRGVAAALCRSEETVRCQLKAIFAKTGAHSQARLLRLLYALTVS